MNLEQHPYVRPSQVIESMRDNGYKNTAYALAELIDNSIQAGAKVVRFVCFEAYEQINSTSRRRIQKIAILDDVYGMDEKTKKTLRVWVNSVWGYQTQVYHSVKKLKFGAG
jgi:hypothetical protein